MTPEEIELLSELTIVIPTCNRPLELERAIEYWRDLPVTVHILDGSEKPWFPVGLLSNLSTISYHHIPQRQGEHYMVNICRRMMFAVDLPRTKFSALCADDDFFTISGLVKFCQRLSNDNSVDSLVGTCAEYTMSGSEALTWNLRYTEWKANPSSQSDDLRTRVLDTSSVFYLYYAIMRTECWKKTIRYSFNVQYDHDYFHEHAMKAICRAHGKSSFEGKIYWIKKSFEFNPAIPNQELRERETDWFRNPKNKAEVNIFKGHLSNAIALALPESDKGELASEIVDEYLKRVVRISDTARFRRMKKQVLLLVLKLFRGFPSRYRKKINQKLPKNVQIWLGFTNERPHSHLIKNNKQELFDFCKSIESTGIQFEASDFVLVERILSTPREELRLRANI